MCRLAIVPPNLLDRTQQKLKELSTAGCINFKTESFFEKKQGIRKTEGRPLISLDFEPTLEEIKLKGYEFDWVSDAKHNRGTMFIAQTGAISSRILLDYRFHEFVGSDNKRRNGKTPLELTGIILPEYYNFIKLLRESLKLDFIT